MTIAYIKVPMVPPSVNAYTRHANGHHYKSRDARSFEAIFPVFVNGQFVSAKSFKVFLRIVLGRGDKGDADNFAKMPLDMCARAGVFRDLKGELMSDAHVDILTIVRDRKTRPSVGWVEITVAGIEDGK